MKAIVLVVGHLTHLAFFTLSEMLLSQKVDENLKQNLFTLCLWTTAKEPCSKDPVNKFVRYAQSQPKLTDPSKDAI